jgi:hypothetical protein
MQQNLAVTALRSIIFSNNNFKATHYVKYLNNLYNVYLLNNYRGAERVSVGHSVVINQNY